MKKLDLYEFQLSRLKYSYHELSKKMNNQALVRKTDAATEAVKKGANDVLNNLIAGFNPATSAARQVSNRQQNRSSTAAMS